MSVVRLSRYEFCNAFIDPKGRTFLDVPPPVSKGLLFRGASRKTVRSSDTLWSLAWAAYESLLDIEQDIRPTSFFDVVAQANDVVDPTAPLPDGKTFAIPTIEVLLGDVRVQPPLTPTTSV